MSTTLIVILVVLAVLIGMITINYYRMKNAKPVADNPKIKNLGTKNFKAFTRKGVVLIDFWAPWCGPCKMVAPVLNDIAETEDNLIVAKVNVDKQQQLAKTFKVRNIPTLVVLKDGVEVHRFVGVKTKRQIMKEVDALMTG